MGLAFTQLPGDPPVLLKAASYIGFHERPGNRGITEFIGLAHCGQEGDPWCAIFANACLEASGIHGTRSPAAISFAQSSRFVRIASPRRGAVCVFERPGGNHVAFYTGTDAQGRLLVLGGNQNNQVCIEPHSTDSLIGFFWPANDNMSTAPSLPLSVSEATLRKLWPHGDAQVPGLVAGIAAASAGVFAKHKLTTTTAIAQAMAQFSHECGAGTEMVENMNFFAERMTAVWPSRFPSVAAAEPYAHNPRILANNVYGSRMGNHAGTDDGYNFRGRGLSQVTGREGYSKLANDTGLDLLNHPELVNDPQHALECAVADFILCGCLPFALKDDISEVTRHLNGGEIGLAERKQWLAKWKAALAQQPATVAVTSRPKPPDPKPPATQPAATWWSLLLKALLAFFRKPNQS